MRLTASEKEAIGGKNTATSGTEMGRYEQMVTLPGPVKEMVMKVDRKNATIVVTLPKA